MTNVYHANLEPEKLGEIGWGGGGGEGRVVLPCTAPTCDLPRTYSQWKSVDIWPLYLRAAEFCICHLIGTQTWWWSSSSKVFEAGCASRRGRFANLTQNS